MSVGITSYGAYIPLYRMSQAMLAQVWGGKARKGERAVANYDEDTITMAVESCMDAMKGFPLQADALYFASTTPAYREKQCASFVAAALDFPREAEFFTADFSNSLRSGTSALRVAYESVKGSGVQRVVVTAAESRLPSPNGPDEGLFGDGSAALVVGNTDVCAEIEAVYSFSSEFMDTWRKEGDVYPCTWEDRFILDEGYHKHVPQAVKGILGKCQLSLGDFDKIVLYAPNARSHGRMVKQLGLDAYRVQDPLIDQVGFPGSAQVPMMLVAALEESKPSDRILVISYSDGADTFVLRVTDQIEKLRDRRGIKGYLKSKYTLPNYGKYIQFKNLMQFSGERRNPDVSSQTMLWRDSNQYLRFHGGKCRNCGTVQHPIQRVCAVCKTRDDYEEVRLADKKGKVFTFSMDDRAMIKDLPSIVSIIDFEGGGRYVGPLTDRIPEDVEVGMEVEMTLRNLHDGSGLHNYCWKPRPVRG